MSLPLDPDRRAALVRTAARASVATAAALLLLKLGAWALTGSVSLLASLADSLMDAAASLLTLLALRWASAPPDAEHRFGHGKAESLAGLGQAAFISGSALFLALTAVERLRAPAPVEQPGVGVAVMVASMAATGALVLFQRRVVRLTGSAAVEGDALHYVTDLLSNLATLAALLLAGAGLAWADPLIALLLVAFIARSAYQLGRRAVDDLLDHAAPEVVQAEVAALAAAQEGVLGVHDLRTRQSGPTLFIQLHVELDDAQDLRTAHARTEAVEEALRARWPGAEVFIHQDPVGVVRRGAS